MLDYSLLNSESTFWYFYDQLAADSCFWNDYLYKRRDVLLQNYKCENLYYLYESESGEKYGIALLNYNCPIDNFIWIREKYRGNGYGSFFINNLNMNEVHIGSWARGCWRKINGKFQFLDKEYFWEKNGFIRGNGAMIRPQN
jgi:hypothetical protein